MIEVQVHWRILGICLESLYDRSSTAYLPIAFANEDSLDDIEYRCWNLRHGVAGKSISHHHFHSSWQMTE